MGNSVFIEQNMDRYLYTNILEQNFKPSVDKLGLGAQRILQQDNDSKHTAHIVQYWLLYYAPRQLSSPPQSPKLNPIEDVWNILTKKFENTKLVAAKPLKQR